MVIICINREGSYLPSSSLRISSRPVFSWFRDRGGIIVLFSVDILQRSLSQLLGQAVYLLPPDLLMLHNLTLLLLISRAVVDAVVEKL